MFTSHRLPAVIFAASFALFASVHAIGQSVGDYDVNRIDPRQSRNEFRPGEVIVKFRDPALRIQGSGTTLRSSSARVQSLFAKLGVTEAEELMPMTGREVSQLCARSFSGTPVADTNLSTLYLLKVDAQKASANVFELVEQLQAESDVEYAEPNYIVHACAASDYTADPLYPQQWGIPAINLDKLWNMPIVNEERPVIAILDTGVDITHPDLADNIWTNLTEADGADGYDDDGNGFRDDIHGWDFVNQSPRIRDNNGHGTHCAGIAAATGGNGIGIVGANPDALIMPVTVMQSDGTGDVGTIIKGIDYAVANGSTILSMSFGSYADSKAERDALGKAYQKALLVAAAGNDGFDLNGCHFPHFIIPMFPAAYNFVLGVQASQQIPGWYGYRAGFSNFDCDGPFSCGPFSNEQLYSYDIMAPGDGIVSTYPGGGYKTLNGTSMACPMAAGAISRLLQCKDGLTNRELLFADLTHTLSKTRVDDCGNGDLDILKAYEIKDEDRTPTLSVVSFRIDDSKYGDGDSRPDAGEKLLIYPTFRNFWGTAKNIQYTISVAENEDPEILSYVDTEPALAKSAISSYATVESEKPVVLEINPNCVDGRHISLLLTATCDNIAETLKHEFVIEVENGVELGGVLTEDLTLYPDKHYIVTSNLVVAENVTLTIMPGTNIEVRPGISISCAYGQQISDSDNWLEGRVIFQYINSGKIIAEGLPNHNINFYNNFTLEWEEPSCKIDLGPSSRISFCNFRFESQRRQLFLNNQHIQFNSSSYYVCKYTTYKKCQFIGFMIEMQPSLYDSCPYMNEFLEIEHSEMDVSGYSNFNTRNLYTVPYYSNILGKYGNFNTRTNYLFGPINVLNNFYLSGLDGSILKSEFPSYFGSAVEKTARKSIFDIYQNYSMTLLDLSNMRERPVHEAPGIVWKVVVDGYDAQDEFDWLAPLGVGRHKFEVYFSKQMNREKTPMLAMGVRPPYTQTAIAQDGEWREEVFDGDTLDVYTAWLDIRGKDNFDGLNRIYVADAEDLEYFPIPTEDVRFNVNVQSAGSMSAGFMAEPGVGKVKLTWENPEENFDDMLGYNLYRYQLNADETVGDTIRINEQLLDTEEFTDFDITPGNTYCYYYKVMRTSLEENAPSRTVSATPRAAAKGDADASGAVDVGDVVAEVNYMVGREQKPFIFDAADINDDTEVDILDVVGTVNIILSPEGQVGSMAMNDENAVYTVDDDGVLWIDSPVELAGIQLTLRGRKGVTEFTAAEGISGMEYAGDWLDADFYRFLAFSMSGRTIESGRTAVMHIGNAEIDEIKLVDAKGNRVMAMSGNLSGLGTITGQQMWLPSPNPFTDRLNVPVVIATEGLHDVCLTLSALDGREVMTQSSEIGMGTTVVTLRTATIPSGFYLLTMSVDGKPVQSAKVIKAF